MFSYKKKPTFSVLQRRYQNGSEASVVKSVKFPTGKSSSDNRASSNIPLRGLVLLNDTRKQTKTLYIHMCFAGARSTAMCCYNIIKHSDTEHISANDAQFLALATK